MDFLLFVSVLLQKADAPNDLLEILCKWKRNVSCAARMGTGEWQGNPLKSNLGWIIIIQYIGHYHALSGSCSWQKGGFLKTFRLILQCIWLVGFCQIASSPFWVTFFQHRLLATLSIWSCSAFKSLAVLFQPFQWFSQLIGGPERIQYPPGRKIRSTSIKYSPSAPYQMDN